MLSRDEKLKLISDEVLDEIYENIIKNKKKQTDVPDNDKLKLRLSKDHPKYVVTLNFINDLLKILGRDDIDDLTEFKNIKRDDLLKPECTKVLDNHLDSIVEHFGKTNILYSRRDKLKLYIMIIIKRISQMCGYTFKSIPKNASIKNKNNKYYTRECWVVYSIY
jgi:hypothetical protein